MNTVFVLFDSLNRNALSCYEPTAKATPAFDRLAERAFVFDNHFVGSLPCMPARRDLLTGRLNFLHRSWGPIEPFDTCFPQLLQKNGVYSHLISDHYHYWEQGGCGYHNQFSSAEFVRGQERDLWKAMVAPPLDRFRDQYHPMLSQVPRRSPNMVNREFIKEEADFPITRCVDLAQAFLQQNHQSDHWFLQLELFDPHEPFTAPARYRDDLPTDYNGAILDWPLYDQLDITDAEARELQANYQAIVAMCDHQLGRVLDTFDEYGLWNTTALIVTTDHGFMLGEHGWWGKNVMPVYDPIARIPLLVHYPQHTCEATQRVSALTQCIDISATLLDVYCPNEHHEQQGKSLLPLLQHNTDKIRDYALYGIFGGALNITDGSHTFFRYPVNKDDTLFEYTLMPVHPASLFTREELEDIELVYDAPFSGGYPLMKLKALDNARRPPMQGGALADAVDRVFDLQGDPSQDHPLAADSMKQHYCTAMRQCLTEANAPPELFYRFNL